MPARTSSPREKCSSTSSVAMSLCGSEAVLAREGPSGWLPRDGAEARRSECPHNGEPAERVLGLSAGCGAAFEATLRSSAPAPTLACVDIRAIRAAPRPTVVWSCCLVGPLERQAVTRPAVTRNPLARSVESGSGGSLRSSFSLLMPVSCLVRESSTASSNGSGASPPCAVRHGSVWPVGGRWRGGCVDPECVCAVLAEGCRDRGAGREDGGGAGKRGGVVVYRGVREQQWGRVRVGTSDVAGERATGDRREQRGAERAADLLGGVEGGPRRRD